jgi:2-phosphoglycerate kinase
LEGVHLDVALITALLARHTSCIPFLIYISNEAKHRERFAVRLRVRWRSRSRSRLRLRNRERFAVH